MTFQEKIDEALRVIAAGLNEFRSPAVMCSFGKDSMVVLHMVRLFRKDIPVIFHREPFQSHKYDFANSVIREWDLDVYDFPPMATEVQEANGEFEIVNHYPAGARTCAVPTGIREPDPNRVVCGLKQIYGKPVGTYAYPWDMVFHGHKSSDVDPLVGAVPLASHFARHTDCASVAFPVRNFTDADVWRYLEEQEVPIHHTRYEKVNGEWREREDKSMNPDYINACVACMRRDGGPVPCPKLGGFEIANVSDRLRWARPLDFSYLAKTNT